MDEKKLFIKFEIVKQNNSEYIFIPTEDWGIVATDSKNYILKAIQHLTNTKQS